MTGGREEEKRKKFSDLLHLPAPVCLFWMRKKRRAAIRSFSPSNVGGRRAKTEQLRRKRYVLAEALWPLCRPQGETSFSFPSSPVGRGGRRYGVSWRRQWKSQEEERKTMEEVFKLGTGSSRLLCFVPCGSGANWHIWLLISLWQALNPRQLAHASVLPAASRPTLIAQMFVLACSLVTFWCRVSGNEEESTGGTTGGRTEGWTGRPRFDLTCSVSFFLSRHIFLSGSSETLRSISVTHKFFCVCLELMYDFPVQWFWSS